MIKIIPIFAVENYLDSFIRGFFRTLTFYYLILTTMAYVIGEDCVACGTCAGECPVGAISEGDIYKIDADACTECGTCAGVCPSEAITLG